FSTSSRVFITLRFSVNRGAGAFVTFRCRTVTAGSLALPPGAAAATAAPSTPVRSPAPTTQLVRLIGVSPPLVKGKTAKLPPPSLRRGSAPGRLPAGAGRPGALPYRIGARLPDEGIEPDARRRLGRRPRRDDARPRRRQPEHRLLRPVAPPRVPARHRAAHTVGRGADGLPAAPGARPAVGGARAAGRVRRRRPAAAGVHTQRHRGRQPRRVLPAPGRPRGNPADGSRIRRHALVLGAGGPAAGA